MVRSKNLKSSFAEQASRLTVPREEILKFLSESREHLSAKEIYISLQKSVPGLGLSTVYRTLELLAKMNIVSRICIGSGQSRYEFKPRDRSGHHHHLICTNCGRIINYSEFVAEELRLVKKTEEKLAKKFNFKIEDHNIEYMGICDKCISKTP